MSDRHRDSYVNNGIVASGPDAVISGNNFGSQQNVSLQSPEGERRPADTVADFSCDIGVITVISEETSAMVGMLRRAGRYRKRSGPGGLVFHEAEINVPGQTLRVAALQAVEQGQQSAANAFHHLSQFHRPAITVLVGIAGAIHPKVALGDVVVVQDVIYYDLRKEVPGKVIHRGSTHPVPVAIRRAANDFFSSRGEPYRPAIADLGGLTRRCSVWPGPIGSGNAVIASADSEIRRYLSEFNDKTLAVEMEAHGLAQGFYEAVAGGSARIGWLAIRGISDGANPGKNDAYREVASWHAAVVFRQMLPFLAPLVAKVDTARQREGE